ncbi:SDR family oxidoreductase [Frondihabitans cladoniiphilus]|uniref:SDR family oxidoreductase n=1 Tax=Frondihabitans cladoniiphilus TaxID=715785 RepID=A0ABP8VQX3_9MICO
MNQSLTARTVLVTGANGGIGEHFVREALERGANRVYAAARTPRTAEAWGDDRIVPLELDVTDLGSVVSAVAQATDVDLVVNNAGIAPEGDSTLHGSEEQMRQIFETNVFGPVRLARAFAPTLAANGGGTVINVASAAAWIPVPTLYAASKSALWSASNGLRVELAAQGTHVTTVLMGMVDTPMATRWEVPKVTPLSVVQQAYDGVVSGALEVLADDDTRQVKATLSTPAEQFYPSFEALLAGFAA